MQRAHGVPFLPVLKTEIGRRIAEARDGLGISQERLAAFLGVARSTVISWETGANAPPADKLAAIGELTDFSGNYLLYGEGRRERESGRPLEERILTITQKSALATVGEIRRMREKRESVNSL
jgi:transcriptional regulator with XRE-family HTH domain